MAYQYDVFLSYRRHNKWPKFVEDLFLPMFQHWLDTILGYTSPIFVDVHDIETGDPWPNKLANGLAHSRVMVCLWSKEYFSSQWCKAELTQMLARRRSLTGPSGAPPLILPVLINDCEEVDAMLADIQKFPLQDYSNPWIAEGSRTAERLAMKILEFVQDVKHALQQAPEFDPGWPDLITEEFLRIFEAHSIQDVPPSLGG